MTNYWDWLRLVEGTNSLLFLENVFVLKKIVVTLLVTRQIKAFSRMKKLLLALATTLTTLLAWGQAEVVITRDTANTVDMLVLDITTVDSVMPTCELVDHPVGAFGNGITNAEKIPGRLVVTLLGDTLYNSGDYQKGESGMTVRVSGNSSAWKNPKPYKIKLQQKADLLFRDNDIYIDKDWRLLRDDRNLNTVAGLMINELMGMQWTPQYKYCNVFINGTYQGLYLLIENVKRNTDCRLNVSKKGYIVERDAYWWNEDLYFKTYYFTDNRYGYTFKYPESDEVTEEQINYIKQYLIDAEKSIKQGTYDEYIDIESFASWLLAHDILGTWDSGGSNLYVTKYDNTPDTKLIMGNLWDFDSSRQMTGSFSRYHSGADYYFENLFNSPNPVFSNIYISKWAHVKPLLGSVMTTMLDEFSAENATAINASRHFVCDTYGNTFVSVASNLVTQKNWFKTKLAWLEKNIGSPIVTPVSDLHTEPAATGKTYNLQGIEVPATTPGLVIRNGKLIKQ